MEVPGTGIRRSIFFKWGLSCCKQESYLWKAWLVLGRGGGDNTAAKAIGFSPFYLFAGLRESFETDRQAKKEVSLQQKFSLAHSLARLWPCCSNHSELDGHTRTNLVSSVLSQLIPPPLRLHRTRKSGKAISSSQVRACPSGSTGSSHHGKPFPVAD